MSKNTETDMCPQFTAGAPVYITYARSRKILPGIVMKSRPEEMDYTPWNWQYLVRTMVDGMYGEDAWYQGYRVYADRKDAEESLLQAERLCYDRLRTYKKGDTVSYIMSHERALPGGLYILFPVAEHGVLLEPLLDDDYLTIQDADTREQICSDCIGGSTTREQFCYEWTRACLDRYEQWSWRVQQEGQRFPVPVTEENILRGPQQVADCIEKARQCALDWLELTAPVEKEQNGKGDK